MAPYKLTLVAQNTRDKITFTSLVYGRSLGGRSGNGVPEDNGQRTAMACPSVYLPMKLLVAQLALFSQVQDEAKVVHHSGALAEGSSPRVQLGSAPQGAVRKSQQSKYCTILGCKQQSKSKCKDCTKSNYCTSSSAGSRRSSAPQ